MSRILIGLYVPSVEEEVDLFVPSDMEIGVLTELLAEGMTELTDRRYRPMKPGVLAMRDPDCLLNPNGTLADYGADDGTRLVLF